MNVNQQKNLQKIMLAFDKAATKLFGSEEEIFNSVFFRSAWRTAGCRNREYEI